MKHTSYILLLDILFVAGGWYTTSELIPLDPALETICQGTPDLPINFGKGFGSTFMNGNNPVLCEGDRQVASN